MKKRILALKRIATTAALSLSIGVAAGDVRAATLTVSAAASLTDAFKEIAHEFQARNPSATVQLNFGGSGALFQQIDKGAPVDVFASADEATMDRAEANDRIVPESRQVFARNTLVVIQPAAESHDVDSLAMLKDKRIERIAIGNPNSVPVGRYTKQALNSAGEWAGLQDKLIFTQNVRQSLDYVARGEVNVGFVYGSDAALMKDKIKIAFTVPIPQPVRYPIARVRGDGDSADLAQRFIDLVMSPFGQDTLTRYGFEPAAGT